MMQASLILALEPDPGQAAQVRALVRRQFDIELVLAESTAAALAALAGRVPDLVLTSALIPPREEAQLVAWLRDLGRGASHVQNVTIPVLTTTDSPTARTGGRGHLRRGTAAAPESCDPAVFADWIAFYLDLAAAGRAAAR